MGSADPVQIVTATFGSNATSGGTLAYRIRGEGTSGVTYRMLATDNLDSAAWQTLGQVTADLSGRFELTDRPGSGPRFYRAVSP